MQQVLEQRPRLSVDERREKQKVLLRDTVALAALAGLVVVLSFVTWGLFHSFSVHRQMLEGRWRARGEAALAAGHPVVALDDLHSALAYSPDDRGLQVELATALAAAGRTQEAQVYFTTLLEGEPGSGVINLELARLAIREGNAQTAVEHYEAAIEGTWNGDAFIRRRDIRLELARFMIAQNRMAEARNLLLITSGNAPDNPRLQLQLGALLEQAGDAADALDVYRKAARNKAMRLDALEAEAHAAAALNRYAQARTYLMQGMGEPGFAKQPEPVRNAVHAALATADGVLALYPAATLPPAERARRIARLAELAQARLLACPTNAGGESQPAAAAQPAPTPQRAQLLAQLGAHLQSLNPLARKPGVPSAPLAANEGPDPLAALAARWTPLPTGTALERQLAADPVFAQSTLDLVYETERATSGPAEASGTAASCAAPAGPNAQPDAAQQALLEKIAAAPDQVEAQP